MKKNFIALTALVLGFVALTSCDSTAKVKLNNGSEQLTTSSVAVDGDSLETLFNKIYSDSSFSTTIKEMFSEQLSYNILGQYEFRYDKTTDKYSVDLIIDSNNGTNVYWSNASFDNKKTFIENHKAYWNWVDTGISITFEEKPNITSTSIATYDERIDQITELAFNQVINEVYTNWCSGTYRKDDKYYEVLFARNVADQLYPLNDKDGNVISDAEIQKLYSNPDYSFDKVQNHKGAEKTYLVNETELDEYSYGLLVDDKYDAITEEGMKNIYEGENKLVHLYRYVDYINKTIMPTIQNTLLVEQYMIENQYPTIGITQQRKIEYIEISDNDDKKAKSLLTNFVLDYAKNVEANQTLDFSVASRAWKGILNNAEYTLGTHEKNIAEKTFGVSTNENPNVNITASGTYVEGEAKNAYSYYKGSKYASLIKDYSKLTTNPLTNDSSLYSSFTTINSRSYSPKEGLKIKTDSLAAENYVTQKWGTKSDFSGLPSDITSKLFSFGIIREIADSKASTTPIDRQYLKQFKAGGVSFLKKDTYTTTNEADSIIWEDSGKFYIVAVYDCVASTLITKTTTNDNMTNIEQIARRAGYTLAKGSTFSSDALEYYVSEAEIVYFDQKVYDYFKSTFPDIFD